ncbi:MAG: hypothetical protein LIO76_00030 [Clostridiales bacterium]|nr:hypothetical protein [Clostridiales bacterium]
MSEINIENIMDEIREEIRQKGYTDDMLSFDEIENLEQNGDQYLEVEYQDILKKMNENYNIAWYRKLEGNPFSRLLKKVVRKLTSFLGVPVVTEQVGFNALVTREFNQLSGYIQSQKDELDKCRQEIAPLMDKVEELQENMRNSV